MKPISVKRTKDQIAQLIRNDILSGALKGGDELTQEQVAEKTGLSRMPVREAFQTLEQEGFLVRLPNRHMRVIRITDRDISQYYKLISDLEYSIYQQLLEGQHPNNSLLEAAKNAITADRPDEEYNLHAGMVKALDNEYLMGMLSRLLDSFYLHALRCHWQQGATRKYIETILEGMKESDEGLVKSGLYTYFSHYERITREKI